MPLYCVISWGNGTHSTCFLGSIHSLFVYAILTNQISLQSGTKCINIMLIYLLKYFTEILNLCCLYISFCQLLKLVLFCFMKKTIYIYIFNSVLEDLESKYKNKYLLFVCIKGLIYFQYLPGLIEQAVSSIVQMSHTVHCYAVERSFKIS